MARLKALCTALRTPDVLPSNILLLSKVLSMPNGTILDLGSHCLMEIEECRVILKRQQNFKCYTLSQLGEDHESGHFSAKTATQHNTSEIT